MRITALRRVLSSIGALVFALAAGQSAAGVGCPPGPTYHLIFDAGNLELTTTAPGAGPAAYIDSPALSKAASNPWREIGEWETYTGGGSINNCVIVAFSPLHVWLGLRNSDDQGTNFDLRAEVRVQNALVGAGEQYCIKGLTRNPALAKEVLQTIALQLTNVNLDGEVSLTLKARIGTGASCGGHASATGLRVYYDSADRDSRFDVDIFGGCGAGFAAC